MKRAPHFALAALLVCTVLLFAQTTPPRDKKDEPGAAGFEGLEQAAQGPGNIDVLSDTMGVDFGPYLERVLHDVKMNWYNRIPEAAYPPERKKGRVAIQFAIMKDGSVSGMKLQSASGDVSLDRAAWGGITASNPFPPLPTEFSGPYLLLRFRFYYNPDKSSLDEIQSGQKWLPNTRVSVGSPNIFKGDVELLAGSSREFLLEKPTGAAVTWNVTGKGCTGNACGVIKGDSSGFYTAPTGIPSPPLVTVTASAEGKSIFTRDILLVGARWVTVSPTAAQVTRGSTLQFSATIFTTAGKTVEWETPTMNVPLTWSVAGLTCAGSECGTISATGLYTAPAKIPDPPYVTVTAALESGLNKKDSVELEIVQELH